MALFPAYADEAKLNEAPECSTQNKDWLENSSFQVNIDLINKATTNIVQNKDASQLNVPIKRSKHKTDKSKKKKHKLDANVEEQNENFRIDLTGNKEFLSVKTISRPAVPKYNVTFYVGIPKRHRKQKFKRYFKIISEKRAENSNSEEESILTKSSIMKDDLQKKDDSFSGFKEEEKLSQSTEFYNKTLTKEPHNIKLWMEYVQFQNTLYQFEKNYRKGSIAKALRVLAERKLSIIDKALSYNQNCEILLRERLNVAVNTYPADELQVQLKDLVEKDQSNIIFWQGYIEATQCSMSHCNTPAVLNLYTKCLSALHKLRRKATLDKELFEESILRMLYQCGLFLKQAGLFEQLWTLLRLYLELNLSPPDKNTFNIISGFKEQELVDLEEVIFNSQLPLHELWLRTEKLRESCHWLPHTEDGECEDPQRLVFTEDVSELIHPITMPENIFKLTATILTLLKIPLLPCRHVTMQELGLDYVPWALDSIESILPIFMPLFPVDTINKYFLNDNRLAVGPQYLKVLPGQEEYLEFIMTILKNCTDCLKGNDKVATTVWLFRFQRLLIILDNIGKFKMSQSLKKKIRNGIKNLMKQPENRNNQIYYCEYALIEKEFGNIQNSISILQTALGISRYEEISLSNINMSQATYCYLNRTLLEMYLYEGSNEQAVIALCKYALQRDIKSVNPDIVKETGTKFKLVTLQLSNKKQEKKAVEQLLPDFFTDWVICNGWFLYLTAGALECGSFIENTLAKMNEVDETSSWSKEVLFEFYVAILFKHCTTNAGSGIFKILDDVLQRAVETYPNNLYFMAVLAKEQSLVSGMGQQWWRVENLLLKTGRAFPILFAITISMNKVAELQEYFVDTITGEKCDLTSNFRNKILSLFKKATNSETCTRRCGLIWRLYLQFIHTYFDQKLCRNVYYSAVEECPWLKALYIDAAIYIPAELSQIQDLIIEKQLRLHVTPEELDVLRN